MSAVDRFRLIEHRTSTRGRLAIEWLTKLRHPRRMIVLAESAESRPCRYAVTSRAWTRRPQPRDGRYEDDGGIPGTRRSGWVSLVGTWLLSFRFISLFH